MHKKREKGKKMWVIIGILLMALIIMLVISSYGVEEKFNLKDRCGPIMNLISHTIQDESVCKTRCKSQCETKELDFSRAEFGEAPIGCHNCTCVCKRSIFRSS